MSFTKAREAKRKRVITAAMLTALGDTLLTKADIHRAIGISPRTIGRLAAEGKLTPIREFTSYDLFAPDEIRQKLAGIV